MSKAYLHRLERHGSAIHPSVDVTRRIVEALGLDAASLISDTPGERVLPVGLREFAGASHLPERDLEALLALAPFASEDAPADGWGFAHEALSGSIVQASRRAERKSPSR